MRILFYILSFIVWITYVLSGWSGHFNPASFWPSSFAGTLFPWLFGLIILLSFIHYRLKNTKWFTLFVIFILIGWFSFNRFYKIPHVTKTSSESINILSYNIYGLRKIKNKNKSKEGKNRTAFLQFIKNLEEFDVLLFQEFNINTSDNFISNGMNTPNLVKFKKAGVAILSNHDILDKGIIRFKKSSNAAVWADIKIKDKIIRFYSVHLQSNQVSNLVGDVTDEKDVTDPKTWESLDIMLRRVNFAANKRSTQVEKVLDHIAKSPYPVIIGADMNVTPWSYPYHRISSKFQDAFFVNGRGSGISYAGALPGLKIDYIFADSKFDVLDSYVPRSDFSDHYPQVAKLIIKD